MRTNDMTRLPVYLLILFISLPQYTLAGTPGDAAASASTSAPNSTAEPSTAFDINHLQSLFKHYKRAESYRYAKQYQSEMEGDPYFDYLFGVSAIDTGNASEGTFALERVLLSFPDDQVARLELARGYFNLQEYSLAKDQFNTVLKSNPPEKVKSAAYAYLDKIRVSESRYRPTHSGFIEFALGNDDNANGGLNESAALLTPIPLEADSFGQADNFTSVIGSWTYVHPVSPGWLVESSLSGNFRKNQQLSQFDTNTATVQLGLTHLQATNKYKAELIAQQFQLDGGKYRSLNGINLNWQHTISQQSSLNSTLQYAQLDYPDYDYRNSNLLTLAINYTQSFSVYLQPLLFTTLTLGNESATDSTNTTSLSEAERDIYSLRVGVVTSFTNTLAFRTSIGSQNSAYAGTSAFSDGEKREDNYNSADLGLIWAFDRKWRLDTRYSYVKNDSNDEFKSYTRSVLSVAMNYTF